MTVSVVVESSVELVDGEPSYTIEKERVSKRVSESVFIGRSFLGVEGGGVADDKVAAHVDRASRPGIVIVITTKHMRLDRMLMDGCMYVLYRYVDWGNDGKNGIYRNTEITDETIEQVARMILSTRWQKQ